MRTLVSFLALMWLFRTASAGDDAIVTIDLPPIPAFNMFEHIRNMPKPERVFCRSKEGKKCPAAEKVRVLGSIDDTEVEVLLSLVERKRMRVSQITGDARAAELIVPILDLGQENFLCYTITEQWKCVSLGSWPY